MSQNHIRPCTPSDFETVWTIINDGASVYRGHVPPDRLHDPYMSQDELRSEIASGVQFSGYESNGHLAGVMGIQHVRDVTLIRHAYVLTAHQGEGIGSQLLQHLRSAASRPVLIGTWATSTWAIRFYQRHGFQLVTPDEKNRLLRTYWNIPDRQIETSVVLADQQWFQQNTRR
jgi:N-acetylglutamate synthase-like GNAT family acetyltransferase